MYGEHDITQPIVLNYDHINYNRLTQDIYYEQLSIVHSTLYMSHLTKNTMPQNRLWLMWVRYCFEKDCIAKNFIAIECIV